MSNQELAARAAAAIERAEKAGLEHARLCALEMDLEADRAGQKTDAILRIMQSGDNPLTQRPHSASSAEAQVETDHAYRAYLRQQSECVLSKNEAETRARSARLLAQLAIVTLGLESLAEVA